MKVVQIFIRSNDELIIIHIGDEIIETTSEYPFYVEGKGWIRARELETGDVLRLLNGENISIDEVEVNELGGKVYVYNFEVEDFHTYFVGENNVLVHNTCNGNEKLTISQRDSLKKLNNTIRDHLTEKDFSGTLRDLQGNPVPNGKEGYYNHLYEMKTSYRTLKGVKKD